MDAPISRIDEARARAAAGQPLEGICRALDLPPVLVGEMIRGVKVHLFVQAWFRDLLWIRSMDATGAHLEAHAKEDELLRRHVSLPYESGVPLSALRDITILFTLHLRASYQWPRRCG